MLRKARFIIASIQPSEILVRFLESIEKVIPEAQEVTQVQIIISCNYTDEQLDEFYSRTKHLDNSPLLVVNQEDKGLLARFNRALEALDDLREEDILLFCNDDLVLERGFVKQLFNLPAIKYLAGPLARGIDGHVQLSIYRRKFTPLLLFFRLYDGGLYSAFLNDKKLQEINLNSGRETVDGCCFILPGQVIREIGGKFDSSIYLYCEEIYLQYLVRKHGLKCFVDDKLLLTHVGGASLTHNWSVWQSKVQRASRLYAAKQYLNCGPFILPLLYLHLTVELWIRQILNFILRR